ncbi:MAG TPA: hypothetical protein VFX98_03845, partial [Longimicrobiaceae bacterium]|nr:hypothetical protein [Longimicrobiaceae bacterium]
MSSNASLARRLRPAALALILAAAAVPAGAQPAASAAEARTARYLEAVRDRPPLLVAFLRELPKGGDLHSHLSGAVYAESYLRWAAEDSLCIAVVELVVAWPPCTSDPDTIPAAAAIANGTLYGALIDAWSMRNWNAARKNGHDQFFDTFGKFGATDRRTGDMLAEAASRAAHGRVSYLELMLTADGRGAVNLGTSVGWDPDFARLRDKLLAAGLRDTVAKARSTLDRVEARRDTVLGCGAAAADPGCGVTVRWLYQVARANPPEQVFAQIMLGFMLAQSEPRVVGFNLVQPEDALVP